MLGALSGCDANISSSVSTIVYSQASRASVAVPTPVTAPGFREDYAIEAGAAGKVSLTDKLTGEVTTYNTPALIHFVDIDTSFDAAGPEADVYRVYQAAFDRKPDAAGLGYWISAHKGGMSMDAVADQFIGSDEFAARYGKNVSDRDFVGQLYRNILHRSPEQAGLDWWTNALGSGVTRAGALASFSDGSENRQLVLPALLAGFDFAPPAGATTLFNSCTVDGFLPVMANNVGGYLYINNVWNAANAASYSQCVKAAINKSTWSVATRFAWDFASDVFDVKSYPEILVGHRPGTPSSTIAELPRAVRDIRSIKVSANVVTSCSKACQYNNDFDLFLQASTTPVTTWNPSTELMVITETSWMNDPNIYKEPVVARVTIGGISFKVVHTLLTNPTTNTAWNYVAYIAENKNPSFSLDLKAFLDDAVARGIVRDTEYLATVEYGTEVVYGSGVTRILDYNVHVN
jgi:hypothetical protein